MRVAGRRVGFAGDRGAEAEAAHVDAARRFFRPELYNRIDRVVSFRALDRAAVAPLVQRQLAALLGRRGLERSSVLVEVEPELVETLIDRGFDPRYGARSLRRELEQRLALPLAEHLVQRYGLKAVVMLREPEGFVASVKRLGLDWAVAQVVAHLEPYGRAVRASDGRDLVADSEAFHEAFTALALDASTHHRGDDAVRALHRELFGVRA